MLGGGFRKKTKRGNLRKKVATSDSDNEDNDENAIAPVPRGLPPVAPPPAVVAPVKPIKSSSKTMLSFGDEMEKEDEFVVKKTKASANLENQIRREKKMKKKRDSSAKNSPILEEVKKENTLIKSQSAPIIKTFNEEEVEDDVEPSFNRDDFDVSHKFNLNKGIPGGAIPNAAMIYAMKKKREQARQFSDQVAYIPLNKQEGRFPESKSRLIREEDSSDEDRIEMRGTGKVSHPQLERRKQVAQALEDFDDAVDEEGVQKKVEEEDEEMRRWEDEQIRKGSSTQANQPDPYGPKLPPNPSDPNSYVTQYAMQTLSTNGSYTAPAQSYHIPVADTQIYSVDMLAKKLHEELNTKKQMHKIQSNSFGLTTFNIKASKDNLVDLEKKSVETSERFTFFQDIRGFVKDLLECLNEKVKRINQLEENMHSALKKRNEKIMKRRQNDVRDEAEEVLGKSAQGNERATNLRNHRIAEREARRARRKEARRMVPHDEGMSSDDEMIPSETVRHQSERENILKGAESIFDDVVSDFTSIRDIMSRFEQWKLAFDSSYKDAYLSICLPKLFSPFIRLQLLNWNPLEADGTEDFEQMEWFRTLAMYSHVEREGLEGGDDDLMLLPNIIEKVLFPKYTALLQEAWDPLSEKQTKLAVFLFQRLVDDYPTITKGSKHVKLLVDTIVVKLKTAVETDLYIPLYSKAQLEANNSKSLALLERQFWKGYKLLGNLMEWNWMLSQKKLQELGLDAVLNRYLIIALQQIPDHYTSFERAKKIVNLLPKEWFEKSDSIIVGLQSLARYLVFLAGSVQKSLLGYTEETDKRKAKILVKKIISLLMHIQAFDQARTVAQNLKEL